MEETKSVVIKNFLEISQFPRCSGHEKKLAEYLYDRYKKKGFDVSIDAYNNVLIKKAGNDGLNRKPIILQGHLDMVCEKTKDSKHDFSKDPIDVIFDEDTIYAKDTTLGADDGMGVAMAMSILDSDDISHPDLEVLFTTSEETGMDGAIGFDKSLLKGQYMINIDSDEEGILTASCAGGLEADFHYDIQRDKVNDNSRIYKISLDGLKGGHSGSEISRIHLNAIKLLFEILDKLRSTLEFNLLEFHSGTKHNAIPNRAYANILIKDEDTDLFLDNFKKIKDGIVELNLKREPDIAISYERINKPYKVSIVDESFKKISLLVQLLPHGVNTMMEKFDIPESSDNLAILNIDKDGLDGVVSIRSSSEKRLEELKDKIKKVIDYVGGSIEFNSSYPAWEFKEESKLREQFISSYKKITGQDMLVKGIHAGLECGLFAEYNKDLDIVSFGPNLYDIHTTNEKASISSANRNYELLVDVIENLN